MIYKYNKQNVAIKIDNYDVVETSPVFDFIVLLNLKHPQFWTGF